MRMRVHGSCVKATPQGIHISYNYTLHCVTSKNIDATLMFDNLNP